MARKPPPLNFVTEFPHGKVKYYPASAVYAYEAALHGVDKDDYERRFAVAGVLIRKEKKACDNGA